MTTSTPAAGAGSATAPVTTVASAASAFNAVLRQIGRAVAVLVLAMVVLGALWYALLKVFDVPATIGKTPVDV